MNLMSAELASILTATVLLTAVWVFLVYVVRQFVHEDKRGEVMSPFIETLATIGLILLIQIPQYAVYQFITAILTAAAVWLISVKITLATD